MELSIRAWSAWLSDCSNSVENKQKIKSPDISWVPAGMRRRLSSFAKMALSVAHDADRETLSETIFATRHGDLTKTLQQLHNLVHEEPISPTQFALSVHNAVNGQYAIATGNVYASTTLSAGLGTFEMALVAAYARLSAKPQLSQVLIIFTDETVPEIYQGHGVEAERSAALALVVGRSDDEQSEYSVHFDTTTAMAAEASHSTIYGVLEFLQDKKTDLEYENAGYSWHWQRHQLEIAS